MPPTRISAKLPGSVENGEKVPAEDCSFFSLDIMKVHAEHVYKHIGVLKNVNKTSKFNIVTLWNTRTNNKGLINARE